MTTTERRTGFATDFGVRRFTDVRELLPDVNNPSPLVRLNHVPPAERLDTFLKLEWLNPFGSVKDRTAA